MIDIAQILGIENLKDYKIHMARYNGHCEPLDIFLTSQEEWHKWNKWRNKKDEFNRKYIVSFIQFYPEQSTWLFGGIYEVIGRGEPDSHSYDVNLLENGKELIGRLKIKAEMPRGRAFKLENFYDELLFSEILKETYNGEIFCGYDNISIDFSSLEIIYKNERTDWKSALENIKGIYVIADKKTGKKYVGSAYGDFGIWSRWADYIRTGHAGNVVLKELLTTEGKKYAQENFRITLIESYPFKIDDSAVIQRENFWKNALLSRTKESGYNKN